VYVCSAFAKREGGTHRGQRAPLLFVRRAPGRIFIPYSMPCFVFGRPYSIAREVPFMHAEQFVLGHRREALALRWIDIPISPFSEVGDSGFAVHARPHDLPNDVAQRSAMFQPKRVGLAN
jgi:hypothetical protein